MIIFLIKCISLVFIFPITISIFSSKNTTSIIKGMLFWVLLVNILLEVKAIKQVLLLQKYPSSLKIDQVNFRINK